MPEGPEIRRVAGSLANAIAKARVRKVFFSFDDLKRHEQTLPGSTILSVRAYGKAILTRFSNDLYLYSHNQLYGRWQIIDGDDYPPSSRQLRVAIHSDRQTALLYSASNVAVLDEDQVQRHPYLTRLGPDLLDNDVTLDQVAARLNDDRFRRRALLGLLQDQSVLAGMGNYLCCETLHVSGIHPQQRVSDLTDDQLTILAGNCLALTRQSYATGGITNDINRADSMKAAGLAFEDYRFHVYRREGQACYRCGTAIVKARFGGRMAYVCPACQAS